MQLKFSLQTANDTFIITSETAECFRQIEEPSMTRYQETGLFPPINITCQSLQEVSRLEFYMAVTSVFISLNFFVQHQVKTYRLHQVGPLEFLEIKAVDFKLLIFFLENLSQYNHACLSVLTGTKAYHTAFFNKHKSSFINLTDLH